MKTIITTYQLINNSEIGFSIIETDEKKYSSKKKDIVKTGNKEYQLWVDNYEGGEAYETDWEYIKDFKSNEDAMEYITKNYGEIKEI